MISLIAGLVGYCLARHPSGRAFFGWLALVGLLVVILLPLSSKTGLLELATDKLSVMTGLPEGAGFSSLFGLGFLLATVPAVVVFACLVAMAFAWLVARSRADQQYRPGLDLSFVLTGWAAALLVLVVSFAFLLAWAEYPETRIKPDLAHWVARLLPGMSMVLVAWLALATILLGTWVARDRWAERTRAESYTAESPTCLATAATTSSRRRTRGK